MYAIDYITKVAVVSFILSKEGRQLVAYMIASSSVFAVGSCYCEQWRSSKSFIRIADNLSMLPEIQLADCFIVMFDCKKNR